MSLVVLIHGFLGSPQDWSGVQAVLDAESKAVVIPIAANWQSGVEAVYRLLPAHCVIVGYSMGAQLAMGCALADPDEKIAAAMFVSGNPGLDPDQRHARWQHDLSVCDDLGRRSLDEFLGRWYRQSVFQPRSDADIELLIEDKRQLDRQQQIRMLQTYSIAKQPDYWPELVRLEIPVAVVAGERDDKYVDIGRQMTSRIPKAEFHLASDCGHIVHRERPKWFAALLDRFVKRLPKES